MREAIRQNENAPCEVGMREAVKHNENAPCEVGMREAVKQNENAMSVRTKPFGKIGSQLALGLLSKMAKAKLKPSEKDAVQVAVVQFESGKIETMVKGLAALVSA